MNYTQDKLSEIAKKEGQGVFGFFIKRFRLTYLILTAIVVLGFFSLLTLPREADPEVKVPTAVVTTIFPGANPNDVEELITDKIEEKIDGLDNLNRYTSSSGIGVSNIVVEFEADADLKESFRKLREAVDESKPNLPGEVDSPMVAEIRLSDIPIVTFSLVGKYSDSELKFFADTLQNELEKINSVSKVSVLGGLTREYQILVDQTKMQNFGVSLTQIAAAISQNNFNLPAGNIEIDTFKYGVRVKNKSIQARDLENIVISSNGGVPVFIRDVAEVLDTFKTKNTESRIGFPDKDAQNTVSLQIFKKTGGNILDINDEALAVIERLQNEEVLPVDLTVQKTNDNAVFIRRDLRTLGSSGLQTMVLIMALLLLALGVRYALITALSVPIAFLLTFAALSYQGMTLNGIVLFSLVLSLGLMVDNSIVVIEGIVEYTKKGKNPLEASILSVWNYKWPIIAGTMTTVSAFLPMLLVSGILGEFLSVIPKTITSTLLSSLFVSLIIIPTLSYRIIQRRIDKKGLIKNSNHVHKFDKIIASWQGRYKSFMEKIIPYKKKRRRLIAAAWIIFVLTALVPISGLMRVEMFPRVDVDYFVVNVELPVGSILDETKTVTTKAESVISQIPELDNFVTNLGTSASLGLTQADSIDSNSTHLASITANLVERDNRDRTSFAIADSVRSQLEEIEGGSVTVEELQAGPPTGSPIEARIVGDDLQKVIDISKSVVRSLERIEGVINVHDSIADSTGEITFVVNKERAAFYGLTTSSIANNLRTAVNGFTAASLNVGGDDVDITVKYGDSDFNSVVDLQNLLIASPAGDYVALSQVADVDLEPSLQSIQHRNGDKTITVRADIKEGVNLQKILSEFENKLNDIETPKGHSVEVGGEVEDIEKSFRETFTSMIVAVILIAFILILQFNSFRQPFIILFTLPLAVIGVIIGLTVFGQPFSFPAFIGIVALSGIVVNDAIVLIDRINKNLRSGMGYNEGIIEAGQARMQPILLTSITTIAGIFPLIFADELWRGLGLTVIFGLMLATVLTLVIAPVMYAGISKKEWQRSK